MRLYGDLTYFADADRDGVVRVPAGGPRSVKDLVESIGVPHPEVGLLVIDHVPAPFERRVTAGQRVAVYPPLHELVPTDTLRPTPPDPRRFVLDVHLGTLARRLRTLGFDCWYSTDADDPTLAAVAVEQDRILLTRDRGLLMRGEIVHGYCPRSDAPDVQLREVVRRYELAPRIAPFSRCVRCNAVLDEVALDEVYDDIPPRTRVEHTEFARCPTCGQIYWPGSHHEALHAELSDIIDGD